MNSYHVFLTYKLIKAMIYCIVKKCVDDPLLWQIPSLFYFYLFLTKRAAVQHTSEVADGEFRLSTILIDRWSTCASRLWDIIKSCVRPEVSELEDKPLISSWISHDHVVRFVRTTNFVLECNQVQCGQCHIMHAIVRCYNLNPTEE